MQLTRGCTSGYLHIGIDSICMAREKESCLVVSMDQQEIIGLLTAGILLIDMIRGRERSTDLRSMNMSFQLDQ